MQETACQIVTSIKQIKKPEYFKTWVIRILINTAYQELRKRKDVIPIENIHHLKSNNEIEDKIIERIELRAKFGSLKKEYKTAILLFYYHEFSIKEIASIMNIPEGTVKTYLSRGKEMLRTTYKGDEEYEKNATKGNR